MVMDMTPENETMLFIANLFGLIIAISAYRDCQKNDWHFMQRVSTLAIFMHLGIFLTIMGN